jgi:hypothetical protein
VSRETRRALLVLGALWGGLVLWAASIALIGGLYILIAAAQAYGMHP